jgi:hypothetical protein
VPPGWAADLLLNSVTPALEPRVSPDGYHLAFTTLVEGQAQVAVLDLRRGFGGGVRVLTTTRDAGYACCPCWSQDGTQIYFTRYHTRPLSVAVVGAEAVPPEERLVTAEAGFPQVLPDGTLLITRLEPDGRSRLYRHPFDGGADEPIGAPFDTKAPGTWYGAAKLFHDGKEALVVGILPPEEELTAFLLEIGSGRVRRFRSIPDTGWYVQGVTPDDRHVLVAVPAGDQPRLELYPRSGGPPRPLLMVHGTPEGADLDAAGNLYLAQSARPTDLLLFPARGGKPDRVGPELPPFSTPFLLDDGRIVLWAPGNPRLGLRVMRPGERPRDLVQTPLQVNDFLPLDRDSFAFLLGSRPDCRLAVASLRNGIVLERSKEAAPPGLALHAATPDGRWLFGVAQQSIWRFDRKELHGERLCRGQWVTPIRADELLVLRRQGSGYRLVRVSLRGGGEATVEAGSNFYALEPRSYMGGLSPDGRVLMIGLPRDSWFLAILLVNTETGAIERLPTTYDGDLWGARWGPDGEVIAYGSPFRSELWRYRREDVTGQAEKG